MNSIQESWLAFGVELELLDSHIAEDADWGEVR